MTGPSDRAAPAAELNNSAAPAGVPSRYRTLLESIDEGFCIIEKIDAAAGGPLDFRIVETNPAYAVQSGLTDVIGKTIRQVVPREADEWLAIYDAVLRTGIPKRFEHPLITVGRVLELYAFRVDDEARRSVAVIFKDITGRKHADALLRDSEERYRRLFESAKDGILILDFASGRIIDANPFMTELLGYSNADFTGKELWEIGLFADKAASEAAVRQLQETGYIRCENLPLETNRGRHVEVEVVGNAYQEHRQSVIQCNIRDITERCALERITHDQAESLAALHRRKDEFLAMLSHELRTPLAPIANAVQMLRLQANEGRVQQQARLIIERQVGQLKHLIDDLLEVSRLTTGKVHLRAQPVAASAIVEQAIEAVRPLMDWRQHKLSVQLPAEAICLHADAARLEQVIVNLLSNAAKYTDDGGQIWLTLDREDGDAVLRIRDTGIGIAPELMPHIFDLFTQGERSLERAQGGLGIGLCLVQRLVELHGGTVAVTSVVGRGSEFVVRLPVAVTALAPDVSPPAEDAAAAVVGCQVLVVDDSVDTAQSLALLLTASGHRVRTAYDGPTALEDLSRSDPDVVVMDIGLPGIDGFEVARRIRADRPTRPVLIAMTGYGQERDRELARAAGFDHHLVKPADLAELEGILGSIARNVAVAGGRDAAVLKE